MTTELRTLPASARSRTWIVLAYGVMIAGAIVLFLLVRRHGETLVAPAGASAPSGAAEVGAAASARHEILLHVPKYDFNWQHTYRFAKPVLAPAGSVLRFTLWWDNSANNPHNPDHTVDVEWGLPTHEEMSQGYMSFQYLDEVHHVVGEPIPEDLRPGG